MDSPTLNNRLDGMRVSVLDENRKPVWSTVVDKGPDEALDDRARRAVARCR